MHEDKLRIIKIEPCSFAPYDTHIAVIATEDWSEVLQEVERELEAQWSNRADDPSVDPWDGLEIKVKCGFMTPSQISEITEN